MKSPYTFDLHKVSAAVYLHNYRQFNRASYLTLAIAHTREALALYRRAKAC